VTRIDVPAREGRGVALEAGARFRAVDVKGKQCGDLFAFSREDVREYASAEHTRVSSGGLFPRPGQPFVTNRRRPILTLLEDHSPGFHDMLVAACDASRYEQLGVLGWHASCQENLQKVMAGYGFFDIEVPQPINVFTNIPVQPDGSIDWRPAETAPGDWIMFRTEMPCYVVLTACPQDIMPINDKNPTEMALDVLDG
jgi:uncharacterized protein YcgI (DUF1989 family)